MDARLAIRSQYRAALEMLGKAVTRCPESLWDDATDRDRFWRVAYHTAFFTHLYLSGSLREFVPWNVALARLRLQDLGRDAEGAEPCSKADVLAYLAHVRGIVDERVPSLDLAAESGFDWLKFDKLELQLYNVRHLQHHTGELMERLGSRAGVEVDWVSEG
jgi:DinB family protein